MFSKILKCAVNMILIIIYSQNNQMKISIEDIHNIQQGMNIDMIGTKINISKRGIIIMIIIMDSIIIILTTKQDTHLSIQNFTKIMMSG